MLLTPECWRRCRRSRLFKLLSGSRHRKACCFFALCVNEKKFSGRVRPAGPLAYLLIKGERGQRQGKHGKAIRERSDLNGTKMPYLRAIQVRSQPIKLHSGSHVGLLLQRPNSAGRDAATIASIHTPIRRTRDPSPSEADIRLTRRLNEANFHALFYKDLREFPYLRLMESFRGSGSRLCL
jgi:hypothetical protein